MCQLSQDIPGQGFKVGEVITEEPDDLDLVLVRVGEPQLKGAKETRRAWYHWSHEPEFSQHMLPLLDADSVSPSQILKYVQDPL